MNRKLKYLILVLLLFFIVSCNDQIKLEIDYLSEITIDINDKYELSPSLKTDLINAQFEYTSSNEEIFTILENEIIPVKVGVATLTISLKSNEDIKKLVSITITSEIDLSFEKTDYVMLEKEVLQLKLFEDEQRVNEALSYSSSDELLATVDSYGFVKALALGEVIISVDYKGKTASTNIRIEEDKTVTSNDLNVEGIKNIYIEDRVLVKAITNNKEDSFVWENLTPSIIDIIGNGLIEGLMPGVGRVKVSVLGNSDLNLIFEIVVEAPIVNVEVYPKSEIEVYDNNNFIKLTNHNNLPIKLSDCQVIVSDENIFTVTTDGYIIGKVAGVGTITIIYNTTEVVVNITILKADEVNQRNQMVEIALTQYGYREGANNDTKYGSWYGMPNQPWCAMFVSWVANELKIMGSIIPKYASVQLGMDWFKARNQFKTYKETQDGLYTPIAGDLLFLKSDGASHTAIVIKVVGDKLYTIEGNTSDQVLMRWYYYKNHSKITGYGIPIYKQSNVPLKDFDITRATFGGGVSTT